MGGASYSSGESGSKVRKGSLRPRSTKSPTGLPVKPGTRAASEFVLFDVFYEDGSHASGPPPRGLYEYQYKIENGQLWVYGGQIPTLSQPV